MKGLKDFRRSLKQERNSGGKPYSPNIPANAFTTAKAPGTIQPPKLVIRAIREYQSTSPRELSFHKGDFFHVLTDPAPNAQWFEASNPMTNARGFVPADHFDVLSKSNRANAATPAGPGASSPQLGSMSPPVAQANNRESSQAYGGRAAGAAMTAKGGGGLYAVVKYDFVAERADELEAKSGESIIVIAQSNFEWFVAKPIGRLGGPGLIPVAFVEIRDLQTNRPIEDVQELIESGVVPKVEEWKKMTADYKKNTIPLGRFDFAGSNQAGVNSPYTNMAAAASGSNPALQAPAPLSKDAGYGHAASGAAGIFGSQNGAIDPATQLPPGMSPGEPLPTGLVTSATVDSFHFEQGDYWFRIQANHLASRSQEAPPHAPTAPDGEERDLILYRLYEDFYEFQIALLDRFPAEAGRETDAKGRPSERILPLMPGPLDEVNDLITSQRRVDLDQYIVELCALPGYIMRSELVRLFFEPRPGDHCTVHPSQGHTAEDGGLQYKEYGYLAGLDNQPGSDGLGNGVSKYAEDQMVGRTSTSSKAEEELAAKTRNMSLGSAGARSSTHSNAPYGAAGGRMSQSMGGAHRKQSSLSQAQPSSGSAANAPYHRIKVVRRHDKENVIALRMPPSPTFAQLLEKVKERLGSDVTSFSCQERAEPIVNDATLTSWLDQATDNGWKFMLMAA